MVVGEFTQEADLVVIGGGPGGYSAAFRAAELGVQTVIVDSRTDGTLGGVCLHEGCIPSKTLLHIAEMIHLAERSAEYGVTYAKPKIDMIAVKAWKEKTVKKLVVGLESLCKKHGVERIQGRAHFEDSKTIALLDGTIPRIKFRRAIIATGSMPKVHETLPFDGRLILTPGEILSLEALPKTILIVGNDYMAVEIATIFAALGSAVTLANPGDHLLPTTDADLVRPLAKALKSRLKSLRHNAVARLIQTTENGVSVTFADENASKPEKFDRVVVTAGHVGNTRGLQLEKTQVKIIADEFVMVDDRMRTADARIFAVGDVTGAPLLADKAIHQGRVAAEAIAGREVAFDARVVPVAVFTDPQIAHCGIMEREAKDMNLAHAVAKIPWGASGRAVGMGRGEGMTKIVYEPESETILGVGMVGPQACEMISEGALAIEMGAVLEDLAATVHPHPTMSELLSDAARLR